MRMIHIAGYSNTGKTLLIDALIPLLPGRVAAVKWSHHPLPPDPVRSDTGRLGRHGVPTLLATPNGWVWRQPDTAAAWPRIGPALFAGYDWVVLEGRKGDPTPKILLCPPGCTPVPPVRLLVCPDPPLDPTMSWHAASVPLDPPAARRLADYIASDPVAFSFAPPTGAVWPDSL